MNTEACAVRAPIWLNTEVRGVEFNLLFSSIPLIVISCLLDLVILVLAEILMGSKGTNPRLALESLTIHPYWFNFFWVLLRQCFFTPMVLGLSSLSRVDEVKSYLALANNLYGLGSNPSSIFLLRKYPCFVRSLEGLANFCVLSLEISYKFKIRMIISSFKIWRPSFSNLCSCISLMSSTKGGWPFLCRDLGRYLKIEEVVAFLKFDVDPSEDFIFPSIRIIPSCDFSSTIIGSKYSIFFLSLAFPMEEIVVKRISYMTSFSI